ncbi:MAG: TonB-dependent receptor [Acidobacteriota bacterium]
MQKIILMFVLCFTAVLFSFSDEKKKEEEFKIYEKVIVTANRYEEKLKEVSTSYTLITKEDIEKMGFKTLNEILNFMPGANVFQNGSTGHFSSLFLRGSSSNHNLVMLDGIPIIDWSSYSYDFSQIPLHNVERIEIIKGPQSTLWGSRAMGGVINLITKKPDKFLSLELNSGSDGTINGIASVSRKFKHTDFSIFSYYWKSNGEIENDGFRAFDLSGKGEIFFSEKTNLAIFLRSYNSMTEIPFSMGFPSPMRNNRVKENFVSIPFTRKSEKSHFSINLSYFDRNYQFNDPQDFFGYTYSKTDSSLLRLNLQQDLIYNKSNILSFGGEIEESRVSDENSFGENFKSLRISNKSLFIQNQFKSMKNFVLTAGVRYDSNNQFGEYISPRITGCYFIPYGNVKIKSSWGKGFRAPIPIEYAGPFGNSELKPETATSWEIGVEKNFLEGRIISGVTYFKSDYKNLIVFDFFKYRMENLAKFGSKGYEFSLLLYPVREINLNFNYTGLILSEGKGQPLLRRTKDTWSSSLNFLIREKINLNLNFIYVGNRKDLDERYFSIVDNPPFNRINANIRIDLKDGFFFTIRISNLLNRSYEEIYGYPSPDRGILVGLQWKK